MVSIARETLFHDKLRFFITVVSLGFAIVMIIYDMGMFFGVTQESVSLVDRAHASLWIAKEGKAYMSAPSQIPVDVLEQVRNLEGVEQACPLDFSGGNLQIGDARQVNVIGIDPTCSLFQPWDVIAGSVADLCEADTIVVDRMALRGNNQARVGDTVEFNDRPLRVVAITQNNKSFSYPFVYVNLQTFENVGGKPGQYNFIAARLKPGADPQQVSETFHTESPELIAVRSKDFRQASISALIAQGVGMIFVIVAVGVVVGMLIITLTLYTATMEQLRDFAILKALGATRWKIWGIVLEQAITATTVSFVIGLLGSLGVNYIVETVSGISAPFPPLPILGSYGGMIILAVVGSLLSIRKATSVDPVMVFRA